jgi:hypothetical protein
MIQTARIAQLPTTIGRVDSDLYNRSQADVEKTHDALQATAGRPYLHRPSDAQGVCGFRYEGKIAAYEVWNEPNAPTRNDNRQLRDGVTTSAD